MLLFLLIFKCQISFVCGKIYIMLKMTLYNCKVDIKNAKIAREIVKKTPKLDNKKVNIIFVSNKEMRDLNRQFRGKDSSTDVLSFNLDEPEILGEVYICLAYMRKQGRADVQEIERMIVHGLLHLAGFDHGDTYDEGEPMYNMQEKILQNI